MQLTSSSHKGYSAFYIPSRPASVTFQSGCWFGFNNTKWINVLVMGFIKTLFQFHRLFSVERHVVFNKWPSEKRHYHCSFIQWLITDAVCMSHRTASTDMLINEWWSGIILEEHCTVLISGTLKEFALSLHRKTTKKRIITSVSDENQTGLLPNASQKL